MAILLPIGIESEGGDSKKSALKYLGQFLFVNPEKMTISRIARIGDARTMGGTVFQPWPNAPDEITFEGVLYGVRSLYDILVLSDAINGSPDYKEVKLIYKWKKFPGFVRSLVVAADASKPRQVNYTLSFVSREAMDLYRLLLGQLTGAEVEKSFIKSQVQGAAKAIQTVSLNNLLAATLIGTSANVPMKMAGMRALALLVYGAVFNIGRGKKGRNF